jgi:F0F1-type ATP synthase membrane subunit b/b'
LKSQQLLAQRDRVLAQAQEEANRTIALAREKSDKLVEKDPTTLAAQAKAEQIIAQARLESDQTRRDADEYVVQTLTALQVEMEKSLNQVKNGIIALQAEKSKSIPVQKNVSTQQG